MWEFTSGIPPFNNRAHDLQLSLSICKGERPEIIENTPQCYIDLMKKCWDKDPLKRSFVLEVLKIIRKWKSIFNSEFKNIPIKHNNPIITESHSQAYYTSRLLPFTSSKLNEILVKSECLDCNIDFKSPGIYKKKIILHNNFI